MSTPCDDILQMIDRSSLFILHMASTQSANSELMRRQFVNIFLSEKIKTAKTSPIRL